MSTDTATNRRADAETLPFRYNAALAGRDRAPLAGPLGRRGHVRRAQPGRAAGATGRLAGRRPDKLFVLDMFPYPSRRRACTSGTRWATSAPTSTPATSG